MAGLAAGWGRWGQPQADVYKRTEIPQEQGQTPGVDTAPKKYKTEFAYNTADRNAPRPNFRYSGMMQNQGILPQVGDPFRTYGTVQGGKVIPPANPFAEPPGIKYTPAGTWEGGGPGPTSGGAVKPGVMPRDRNAPYMPRITQGPAPYGPIDVASGSSAASSGFWNPQSPKLDPTTGQYTIPPPMMPQYGGGTDYTDPNSAQIPGARRTGWGGPNAQLGRGPLSRMYGNVGAGLNSRPFRSQMYY